MLEKHREWSERGALVRTMLRSGGAAGSSNPAPPPHSGWGAGKNVLPWRRAGMTSSFPCSHHQDAGVLVLWVQQDQLPVAAGTHDCKLGGLKLEIYSHRSGGQCQNHQDKIKVLENLLYSRGNSAPRCVPAWMGGEFGGEWTHVYGWLSPCTVHLKLSHC